MMVYNSRVIDANSKVLQRNHLRVTNGPNMMISDTCAVNVVIKQQQKNLSNPMSWWLGMVSKNDSNVMNVITKVLENNHLSATHSPSMVGSDTHVVNVAIKQLQNLV